MQDTNFSPRSPENRDEEMTVAATGSAQHLAICSLVLDSVSIPYRIDTARSELSVPERLAWAAEHHLDSYFAENANWPERPAPAAHSLHRQKQPNILLIGSLAVFYGVTGPWNDRSLWFANGAVNSLAILENHEWWRLVTALTLHADTLHLTGNCVIGGFLVYLLTAELGTGLGWLLLILCGATGNFLNIAARETIHYSVGFSTSIFGAIGMFSGMQILAGKRISTRQLLIPLGAGAGLLAMLGVEGERTDLGAHFFGFLCGILLGLAAKFLSLDKLTRNKRLQKSLLITTLGVIGICWLLAMK